MADCHRVPKVPLGIDDRTQARSGALENTSCDMERKRVTTCSQSQRVGFVVILRFAREWLWTKAIRGCMGFFSPYINNESRAFFPTNRKLIPVPKRVTIRWVGDVRSSSLC